MISAKELQLGDWVLYHGKPARVRNIHDNVLIDGDDEMVDLVFSDKTTIPQVDPIHLDPIPLTGEILLKNGFKHDGMCNWEWEDIRYCNSHRIQQYIRVTPPDPDNEWWSKEDSGFDVCTNWREINLGNLQDVSLHRLQHALRDCNVDKEIEL